MIFVTVGTHEQPFDRLIKCIDRISKEKMLCDEFVVQIGFGTYIPKYCTYKRFFPYSDMIKLVEDARIVITHGGPSSFMIPLEKGKIPVVVPRQKKFKEHINDHQMLFVKETEKKQNNIIVVEDIAYLKKILINYDNIVQKMPKTMKSNNVSFCKNIEQLALELVKENEGNFIENKRNRSHI